MMSTEQNKANLRRFIDEVLNKANLSIIDEIVSPGLVLHNLPPGTPPGTGSLIQFIAKNRTAFPDIHYTIEDQVAEGDRVAVRLVVTGTHLGPLSMNLREPLPPTGKRISMKGFDIWRFDEDGKWVECWSNYDRLSQLQQLGVIPAVEPKPEQAIP